MKLEQIVDPKQLHSLSPDQLEDLAGQIRTFLIDSLSKTGGHLSSNLGVVELTLALHYVFNSPKDKLIFDVGHQSYTHKLLTGRMKDFPTLRQIGGLSGYQKRSESEHDPWEAGHSSTSLSAALGMAIARDLKGQKFEIIPVIGDGALTGGMALEALNDLGAQNRKVIIIFNDNNMSISRNLSGFEKRITDIRSSKLYRHSKSQINESFSQSFLGKGALSLLHTGREFLKRELVDAPLFTQFNLDYIGPVDGHDLRSLIKVLRYAKEHEGPVVVHVKTVKGKGYPFAEKDTIGLWHGVPPFYKETGKLLTAHLPNEMEWSEVFSKTLIRLASQDENIVAITPAMMMGSHLMEFQKTFPKRTFDAGIAEQHAITMAAGMASGGLKPFVAVYSSFLQRAYDQISHDVSRMNLPVVVGVDHAGLVGADGETHQGIYDISFLRTIPNVVIGQPKNAKEAQNMLYSAFRSGKPYFIRYPKGLTRYEPVEEFEPVVEGTWTSLTISKPRAIIISYGADVEKIGAKAIENEFGCIVVNARFFKPVDKRMLDDLAAMDLPIYVYETDQLVSGLGSAILEYYNETGQNVHLNRMGFNDTFVEHGSVRALKKAYGLSLDDLFERIVKDAARPVPAETIPQPE